MEKFALAAIVASALACGGSSPSQMAGPGPSSVASEAPEGADADGTTGADGDLSSGSEPARKPGETHEFEVHESADAKAQGLAPSKLKPTESEAVLRFVVLDKDNGPIKGIVISLKAPNGDRFYAEETDATGYTEVLVPNGQTYELVYLSLGRRDIAARVPVAAKPKLNVKLTLRYKRFDEVEIGDVPAGTRVPSPRFVLRGVEFATGKATLTPESFSRLDSVVEFLAHKKSARIQISGHTDNVGKPRANKSLSERRARACRDYIVSKGIDASRIEAVGFGDERPRASNDTEEGRQKNRRIEATEITSGG